MSSTPTDYYAVLGVPAKASGDEIKKQYRELARRFHPDVNPRPDAAQKIKAINEAYAVLGDAERRATYDAERSFQAQTLRSPYGPVTPSQPPPAAAPRPSDSRPPYGGVGGSGPYPVREPFRNGASADNAMPDWDSLLYGRRSSEPTARTNGSTVSSSSASAAPNSASHGARPSDAAPRAASGPSASARSAAGPTADTNANARPRTAAQRHAAEATEQVRQLVSEAQLAFINHKYAQAEQLCRQVIRADSRNAVAYELLGDCARKSGNTDAAIQAYSYAIQLNPRNQSVQANLDRLIGMGRKANTSGPTLARTPSLSLAQRLGQDVILNGTAALSLLGIIACLYLLHLYPGAGIVADLSPNLGVALVICGLGGGVLLALYGGMRPQAQEFSTYGDGHSPMPLHGVLTLFAVLWFCASLLAYIFVAVTQNRFSASVLRAYALALFLNVIFVLLYHPLGGTLKGAFSVPTAAFAGNLLFPMILAGWRLGDKLRLGRYGGA